MWGYNKLPDDQHTTKCVGGCGGDRFTIQYYNTTVQKIQVWWKEDDFQKIAITFFNGFTNTYGISTELPKNKNQSSFEFKQGEYLIGDVVICGNGHGKNTGQLMFETNLGRTFEAGKPHNLYVFSANNS